MFNIEWKGDGINKHGSRGKWKPLGIGEHISIGRLQSMYWTFSNPNNNRQASAHYGVGRKGEIWQYVDLRRAAWTQGLHGSDLVRATAPIVKVNKNVNPNLYLVSIEHEGYYEGYQNELGETILESVGTEGDLTDIQFIATCWLHKHIQEECKVMFGEAFPLSAYTTPGHFQIDPQRKPFCPGPRYPWARLHAELAIADSMTLESYEEHLHHLRSSRRETSQVFALYTRVLNLKGALEGKYKVESNRKLMLLSDVVVGVGGYKGEVTADGIATRIINLYLQWTKKQPYHEEAFRKLMLILKVAQEMKLV